MAIHDTYTVSVCIIFFKNLSHGKLTYHIHIKISLSMRKLAKGLRIDC